MDKKEEYKIEVLMKEHDSVSRAIYDFILTGEKILGVGMAVSATVLGLGVNENINIILLVLPIGVSMVIFYSIYLTTEMMSMGGYKRYLEERINGLLGEQILLWELFITKKRHRDIVHYFLGFIYFLVLVSTTYIGLRTALEYYGISIFFTITIILSVLYVGLIICIVNMQKAWSLAYKIAKTSANYEVDNSTSSNKAQKD